MQNSFLRLGNKLINLDYVTHIEKKGKDGHYYGVYVAGKDKPEWLFVENSFEGKALRQWFSNQLLPSAMRKRKYH